MIRDPKPGELEALDLPPDVEEKRGADMRSIPWPTKAEIAATEIVDVDAEIAKTKAHITLLQNAFDAEGIDSTPPWCIVLIAFASASLAGAGMPDDIWIEALESVWNMYALPPEASHMTWLIENGGQITVDDVGPKLLHVHSTLIAHGIHPGSTLTAMSAIIMAAFSLSRCGVPRGVFDQICARCRADSLDAASRARADGLIP